MTYGRQEPGEPYKRISVHEALEMQKAGALVVDVRRDDEWELSLIHISEPTRPY